MKKILIVIIFLLLMIGGAAGAFLRFHPLSPLKKEVIYIALAGPMSGAEEAGGKAMLKGAELYLEHLRERGGEPAGKKIELLVFDDKSNEHTAKKVATEIASPKKALLVLGHDYSSACIAAGEIYKQNEICAMTASASAEAITSDNEWYFRIIPGNISQVNFIANYIRKALKSTSATIISDKDSYGSSLAEYFEIMAKKLGIDIKGKWGFDSSAQKPDTVLKKIAESIDSAGDPGILFLAMHFPEAAETIRLLRDMGKKYPAIGPDSLSTGFFIEALKKYPKEQSNPGYYSDGILAISPLLTDVADKEAYFFRQSFIKKYREEPSWIAGCYYDAMHVAVEAVKKADIQGKGHIRSDRRKIREALKSFYNYENAIRGVSGRIYFNAKGNVSRPPFIGFYEKQTLFPDFVQYQPVPEGEQVEDVFRKALEGDIILSDGKLMTQTRVVYAGIYMNEISKLNTIHSSYTADFYLWFRYKGDFDETQIEFLNAVSPVELGQPFIKGTDEKGIVFRAYRIKADFKNDFDFHAYPFDRHTLKIRFRHIEMKKEQLIYVADTLGLPQAKNMLEKTKLKDADDWQLGELDFYQDTVEKVSTLGNPQFFDKHHLISYSRFTAAIPIERKGVVFVFKTFLPVIVMVMIIFGILYLMPADRLGISLSVMAAVLTANTVFHLKLFADLPIAYMSALEYAHLAVFILAGISVFIILLSYASHRKKEKDKIEKVMICAGQFINFAIILSVSTLQIYICHISQRI